MKKISLVIFASLSSALFLPNLSYPISNWFNPPVLAQNQSKINPKEIVDNVDRIAEQITVKIDSTQSGHGSGVIVAKNGNTYYILTANHVVRNADSYKVITHDGKSYAVEKITPLEQGLDMAVVTFVSNQSYQIATIFPSNLSDPDPNNANLSGITFLSGYPIPNAGLGNDSKRVLTTGQMLPKFMNYFDMANQMGQFINLTQQQQQNIQRQLENGEINPRDMNNLWQQQGYVKREIDIQKQVFEEQILSIPWELNILGGLAIGVIDYSNLSARGMSGGPVLDTEGRLVAINTAAEQELKKSQTGIKYVNIGYSLGIVIDKFLGRIEKAGIKKEWLKINNTDSYTDTDQLTNFSNYITSTLKVSSNNDAIEWFNYGNLLWRLGKKDEAIAALDKGIKIDTKLYYNYLLKGFLLGENQFFQGIQTITNVMNPQGQAKAQQEQKRRQEQALIAYNEALKINPNLDQAWYYKGKLLYKMGNYQEALTSFEEVRKLQPENYQIYVIRGFMLTQLNRYSEAQKSYTEAMAFLDKQIKEYRDYIPKNWQGDPNIYFLRGAVNTELRDNNAAIADYTKAIELSEKYPDNGFPVFYAYAERGLLRYKTGDKTGAIADINHALTSDQTMLLYLEQQQAKRKIFPDDFIVKLKSCSQYRQPNCVEQAFSSQPSSNTPKTPATPQIPGLPPGLITAEAMTISLISQAYMMYAMMGNRQQAVSILESAFSQDPQTTHKTLLQLTKEPGVFPPDFAQCLSKSSPQQGSQCLKKLL